MAIGELALEAAPVLNMIVHFLKPRGSWLEVRSHELESYLCERDLQGVQDVSLHMVGEALKMLHGENYITMCVGLPSGFELLEKGRIEASRLGAMSS
jgi:hypothetical protein